MKLLFFLVNISNFVWFNLIHLFCINICYSYFGLQKYLTFSQTALTHGVKELFSALQHISHPTRSMYPVFVAKNGCIPEKCYKHLLFFRAINNLSLMLFCDSYGLSSTSVRF